MSCLQTSPPTCGVVNKCVGEDGCPPNACPDFQIKRHDTQPSFKVSVEDENGPIDLTDLLLEANMWVNAKLKTAIDADDTSIQFAGNVGFNQILENDIIVMDRVRSPEHMLVTGFDETNNIIYVTRGYNSTTPDSWKKGAKLKVFRFMNAAAVTEMVLEDQTEVDGCTTHNVLTESILVYEWTANDTCVPGCFWMEFKLMKMTTDPTPSVTPMCNLGSGIEWTRRFPTCGEFLVKICDSFNE